MDKDLPSQRLSDLHEFKDVLDALYPIIVDPTPDVSAAMQQNDRNWERRTGFMQAIRWYRREIQKEELMKGPNPVLELLNRMHENGEEILTI